MSSPWMDSFGGAASLTCAIHCLVLSLAPTVLSVLGLGVLAHDGFEWGFFATAVLFAGMAAWFGYRAHRSGALVAGFAIGIALLCLGRMAEALELFEGGAMFAILGACALVASHIANIRWSQWRPTAGQPA